MALTVIPAVSPAVSEATREIAKTGFPECGEPVTP
jgi:hypothetical protein